MWELVSQSTSHLSMGELILRAALICCSLFATVQLLSMMATHYGDHHATSKSFFLSLLLHCCFALGWATVVDTMPRTAFEPGEPEKPKVRITLLDDDDPNQSGSARTSWNSMTRPPETELARMERHEQQLSPFEAPMVEKAPMPDPIVPDSPDLPAPSNAPVPVPVPQLVDNRISSPASPSVEIDQPSPQARPETQVAADRQRVNRESSTVDLSTPIELQRGAAERMSPLIEDGDVLTLPTEISPDATVPKLAGLMDETIRRRSNPTPVAGDATEAGSSPTSSSKITTGDRRTDRFARSGSRTATDDAGLNLPLRPTPSPTSAGADQMLASRAATIETPGRKPTPELVRPSSSPLASRLPTRDPETYRSRRIEQRKAASIRNGGSVQSEQAVEASLKWMASIQEPSGFWSASRHGGGVAKRDPQGQNRLDGGLYADSGITGLVVLSFLGAGYTHEEGKYADVVMRALKWLIAQQNPNGYLGGKATRYDMMYCHAMATFALAEAYGMQNDPNEFPALRDAVHGGVRLICAMQNEDGGWRYSKGGESDMSMFGWQLMALKSAVNAGIAVPEENRRGMLKFLQARALGTHGGLAGYKVNEQPTPAMTAEALFCRQMFSARSRDGASQEAVAYLRKNLPRLAVYDEYYWYYGTLAMFQYDGEPWEEWNGALRDSLVGLQRTQGPYAGSWDPNGKWAGIGGRLYSTAISTMCLEVYYRFLRIYQTGDE
jgi:hypothetical protein